MVVVLLGCVLGTPFCRTAFFLDLVLLCIVGLTVCCSTSTVTSSGGFQREMLDVARWTLPVPAAGARTVCLLPEAFSPACSMR